MELKIVKVETPDACNLILGQSHFIKTVEDLYEAMVSSTPSVRFGLAFCESSGERLVRVEGNDEELKEAAAENALKIGCGHSFIIFLRNAYPINVLNELKRVPEVCAIYAATANPIEVIVAETDLGRALIGVVDGGKPIGIEDDAGVRWRKEILRKLHYKL